MKLQPGEVFQGRFRVQREVASGGVGTVYEVLQLSNDKRRALKLLHEHFARDPDVLRSFRQEATIGSHIESPYMVEVIDAQTEGADAPWLLLEWLDGEDLGRVMKARGRLPREEIREIYQQLGDALGAAHDAGVVHCDLKPANVMRVQVNHRASLKIVDFGIARLILSSKTHATLENPVGSPSWMAPEQVRSTVARPAADVWALGMMAFFFFTGSTYWHHPHDAAQNQVLPLLRRVLTEPMPTASARAFEHGSDAPLPAGFDDWFARCTDRDARSRYDNGRAAAHALVALCDAPASGSLPPARPTGLAGTLDLDGLGRLDPTPPELAAARLAIELERVEGTSPPEEIVRRGEQILALDPKRKHVAEKVASASVGLAWSLAAQRNFTAAIDAASRAAALAPGDGGPWYARGVIRGRAGDAGGGLEDLDRAVGINGRVAIYHRERGRVLQQLGRYDEALSAKSRAIELDDPREEFWTARAGVHLARGDWTRAADDYARAIERVAVAARKPTLHQLRARALAAAHRWSEAAAEWAEAIAASPNEGMYWYERAQALRVAGDVASAGVALERAAALGFSAAVIESDAAL